MVIMQRNFNEFYHCESYQLLSVISLINASIVNSVHIEIFILNEIDEVIMDVIYIEIIQDR